MADLQAPAYGMSARSSRGFTQRPTGSTKYLEFVLFEMVYFRSHSDPNTSSTSEKGPSPLLSRASSFAGAWQGKLGESGLELILQQNGNGVTGQFNVSSNHDWIFKDGIVIGNTLRFTVVLSELGLLHRGKRPGSPDEAVGVGELVMDRGSKSFKGTVLGAPTSGTLIGR